MGHRQHVAASTKQGSANTFCKGTESKYFRLSRTYGLCHTYSTLPLQRESRQRQHMNEETWPHSNKTLFVDAETQISYSFLLPHSIILLVIFFQAFKKK